MSNSQPTPDAPTAGNPGPADRQRKLTVREVAAIQRVSQHTVLHWIDTKELAAVNVSRSRVRKRWAIDPAALAAFDAMRGSKPAAEKPGRRRERAEYRRYV